jgi:hypothetical protein
MTSRAVRWIVAVLALTGAVVWMWGRAGGSSPEPPATASAKTAAPPAPQAASGAAAEETKPPATAPKAPGREHGCACPWLPPRVGAVLRYTTRTQDTQGTIRFTLADARREPDATWSLLWKVHNEQKEIAREDDPGTLSGDLWTVCTPGRWAEAPWFRPPREAPVRTEGSAWRWPIVLEPGVRFEGDLRVFMAGGGEEGEPVGQGTRTHQVRGLETVDVPAGTFEALRVDVTEDVLLAGGQRRRGHSVYWVAAGTGLVRAEVDMGDGKLVQELIEADG